ncbi:MAG: TIM23 complex component [Vezdaea aestivalis]|nr:MAG: TIM23 complex component [Vezdaea aestivalis]
MAAFAGTAFAISAEPTIMGFQLMTLDPMILGLITLGGGALGWVVGPMVGSPLFGMLNRSSRDEMVKKDKALYERIKKYRVNPSAQSAFNPVPDYYGEKIGSLSKYRQWLKDQRVYNKKAGFVS